MEATTQDESRTAEEVVAHAEDDTASVNTTETGEEDAVAEKDNGDANDAAAAAKASPPKSPRKNKTSTHQDEEEGDELMDDDIGVMTPAGAPEASPGKKDSNGGIGGTGSVKKESFKWSTPADEFADDVDSDAEEEAGEFLVGAATNQEGELISAEIDGERYEAHRTADGGIVIHLGVEEAGKLNVGDSVDVKRFLAGDKKKRQPISKQKFKCPKCDKIWNWPWELRRHVLTHYKEVRAIVLFN